VVLAVLRRWFRFGGFVELNELRHLFSIYSLSRAAAVCVRSTGEAWPGAD